MRNPQHARIGACRAAPTLVNGVPMIVSAVSRQTSVGPNTLASSLYFWFESACWEAVLPCCSRRRSANRFEKAPAVHCQTMPESPAVQS